MKADGFDGELAAFAELGGLAGQDAGAIVEAARRLFPGECFTISDLTQSGHPLVYASEAFVSLTGYQASEACGRNLGFLQAGDDTQDAAAEARAALQEGRGCICVLRNYRQAGTLFFNEQHHLPLQGADGRPGFLLVLHRDITDAVHAAGAEEANRALAESVGGKGASVGYAMLLHADGSTELTWVSGACRALTGFERDEVLASGIGALVAGEDRERFDEQLAQRAEGERWHAQYRLRTRSGEVVWVDDFANLTWTSPERGVRAVYGILRDVSYAHQPSQEVWRSAHHDPLTDLANRRLLEDRAQQAIFEARREGGAVALALVDLDHFRFLNETLGPRRADRVLQEVAMRLGRHLRRTDTLARLDGDVFAALLTKLPHAHSALGVVEKLQSAVLDPFREAGATLRLSATVGVEVYPDGAATGEALLEHAQLALDEAKRSERGHYRFQAGGFDAAMRARAELVRELRRAVLEDQLVLHYQPKVELQTGAITSVEALVRWAHPERGLLKPAAFLPVAEEARLGGELFTWVLEGACRQAMRWQEQRISRRVAINTSPQALEDDQFTLRVKDALTRYDLHPALLEI
ncbi:MAG: diguanylate cyclase, partial [Deinococcales bacterium]